MVISTTISEPGQEGHGILGHRYLLSLAQKLMGNGFRGMVFGMVGSNRSIW